MIQSNIIPFSRKLASGASNGSTSSSPFFETQNSSPFGTAVASNGSTSSSQFFATQNSSPFGTTVGNSNGASGASCGCTSASPFFATQNSNSFGITAAASNGSTFGSVPFPTRNSNLFGTAVGNSNGAFGASNCSTSAVGNSNGGCGASNVSTFASPFSATQNSNAFVSGADISNGFFSASYTPAYGVVPNRSVNSFGFGAAPSTTSAFRERSPSSTGFGCGTPAIADNSCAGILKNLSWNIPSPVHTSISAMNCYCNKSHEELRSEDYKQIKNGGPSSAANVSGVSNAFQPANSSGWFPPCVPPPFTFNRSSENPIQRTDPSSSPGSDKNRTTPVHSSPVQTSVAQTLPSPTPTTTMSNTASGGVSFIPSFVNCIIPALGASESNGVLNSVLGTPVLGFPVLIPTTLPFIPQYPQVSNPTSALPLLQSESHFHPRMILLNPTSSASTTNPANAHLSTIAETTSHVSLSAGVLGEQITNLSISASPAPTNAAPSGSASPSSIPKGLETIAEHLGFNPWEGKSHLQDSQDGQILLCEDASNDADILSLAEFAVEQHNAMEQDGKVELLKVTAACLEAVDGGRYHIVLEAKKAASSGIRVYAVVLLKKTNRPTSLIVLERWLHCLPSYSSDCSREMVPFRARLI